MSVSCKDVVVEVEAGDLAGCGHSLCLQSHVQDCARFDFSSAENGKFAREDGLSHLQCSSYTERRLSPLATSKNSILSFSLFKKMMRSVTYCVVIFLEVLMS